MADASGLPLILSSCQRDHGRGVALTVPPEWVSGTRELLEEVFGRGGSVDTRPRGREGG